jgi:hypothetical protein
MGPTFDTSIITTTVSTGLIPIARSAARSAGPHQRGLVRASMRSATSGMAAIATAITARRQTISAA